MRSQEAVVLTRGRWQLPWNYLWMGVGRIIRRLGLNIDHYPNAAASWHEGSLFHAQQVTKISGTLGPCCNLFPAHNQGLTVTWLSRYRIDLLRVSPPRVCQGPWASHDWIKHEGRMQSAPWADIIAKPCSVLNNTTLATAMPTCSFRLVQRRLLEMAR